MVDWRRGVIAEINKLTFNDLSSSPVLHSEAALESDDHPAPPRGRKSTLASSTSKLFVLLAMLETNLGGLASFAPLPAAADAVVAMAGGSAVVAAAASSTTQPLATTLASAAKVATAKAMAVVTSVFSHWSTQDTDAHN